MQSWADYFTRGTAAEIAVGDTWGGDKPVILGLDVSDAQKGTNWQPVITQGGRVFTGIKATEGIGWTSPTFHRDWALAGASGLARIAYCYSRPDLGNDPAAEADYLVGVVAAQGLAHGDNFALDIEDPKIVGDQSAYADAFCSRIEQRTGIAENYLYSYGPFIAAHGLNDPALRRRRLWFADYQATRPPDPAGWPITIWQNTDVAIIPGVVKPCDGDVCELTIEQLKALGYQGGSTPMDTLTAEAYARFSALGIQPNVNGALFKVYRDVNIKAWYDAGRPNTLDPTPAVKPEWSDGQDAYVLLDDGTILHAVASKGWAVFKAEEKERADIATKCGWGAI